MRFQRVCVSILLDIIPVQSAKVLYEKGGISVSCGTPTAHPAVRLGGIRGPQNGFLYFGVGWGALTGETTKTHVSV